MNIRRYFNKTRWWFSLIELLVVIVLIAIISIIAFINFGNQSSKARNSIRLDASSKILKAFQLQQLEEKIPSNSCLYGSATYSLTWTLTGTGCNAVLDGSQEAKQFLNELKITNSFQDPLNKFVNGDEFVYEFSYKLGDNQYEFSYLTEPKEEWSLINLNKSYALEYSSWSLNQLNIDWNFISLDKSISPIILKSEQGSALFQDSFKESGNTNSKGRPLITEFNKSTELKEKILALENVKYNGITLNEITKTWSSSTGATNTTVDNSFCLKGAFSYNGNSFNIMSNWLWGTTSNANTNIILLDSENNQIGNRSLGIKVKCEQWNWKYTADSYDNWWCNDSNLYIYNSVTKNCVLKSSVQETQICPWNGASVVIEDITYSSGNGSSLVGGTAYLNSNVPIENGSMFYNLKAVCSEENWTAVWKKDPTTVVDIGGWCNDNNLYIFDKNLKSCRDKEVVRRESWICDNGTIELDWMNFDIWDSKMEWWKTNVWKGVDIIKNWNVLGNIGYNKLLECKKTNWILGWSVIQTDISGTCNNDNYVFDSNLKTCKPLSENCIAWNLNKTINWKNYVFSYNTLNNGQNSTVTSNVLNITGWIQTASIQVSCSSWEISSSNEQENNGVCTWDYEWNSVNKKCERPLAIRMKYFPWMDWQYNTEDDCNTENITLGDYTISACDYGAKINTEWATPSESTAYSQIWWNEVCPTGWKTPSKSDWIWMIQTYSNLNWWVTSNPVHVVTWEPWYTEALYWDGPWFNSYLKLSAWPWNGDTFNYYVSRDWNSFSKQTSSYYRFSNDSDDWVSFRQRRCIKKSENCSATSFQKVIGLRTYDFSSSNLTNWTTVNLTSSNSRPIPWGTLTAKVDVTCNLGNLEQTNPVEEPTCQSWLEYNAQETGCFKPYVAWQNYDWNVLYQVWNTFIYNGKNYTVQSNTNIAYSDDVNNVDNWSIFVKTPTKIYIMDSNNIGASSTDISSSNSYWRFFKGGSLLGWNPTWAIANYIDYGVNRTTTVAWNSTTYKNTTKIPLNGNWSSTPCEAWYDIPTLSDWHNIIGAVLNQSVNLGTSQTFTISDAELVSSTLKLPFSGYRQNVWWDLQTYWDWAPWYFTNYWTKTPSNWSDIPRLATLFYGKTNSNVMRINYSDFNDADMASPVRCVK